ncbi:MAG: hypothetical protein ABIH71_08045 [Candidatus Omnitrophota bacterium]
MKFLKKINIKKIVTHNFWLKIISLIITIIIWLYVSGDITKGVKV